MTWKKIFVGNIPYSKPEDHWPCIAHLSAEDMLKSAVIEETKFKNIESEFFLYKSIRDLN